MFDTSLIPRRRLLEVLLVWLAFLVVSVLKVRHPATVSAGYSNPYNLLIGCVVSLCRKPFSIHCDLLTEDL